MKLLVVASPLRAALLAATFAAAAHAADHAAPAAAPAAAPKAQAVTAVKPDLAKGEALYGQVCAACHGADGNSNVPTQPKLAQQHPHYLVKQLEDFKAGRRKNPIMQGIAASLSEADMKNISYWLATKQAKPGFAKDPQLAAKGERLYRGGDASRDLPACAGCHSPNGVGVPIQYPRLSGQLADYTVNTLTAFREGTRANSVQMMGVAKYMNDHDIKAVADYIAGLR